MNKNQILMIVCLVVCTILSLSVASAADDADNSTLSSVEDHPIELSDNGNQEILTINDDNCNVSAKYDEEGLKDNPPGTFKDLYDYLNDDSNIVGNTIRLERNYEYNENTDVAQLMGIFFAKDNVVIDGQGHTIDAKNQARILGIGLTGVNSHRAVNGVTVTNINFINAKNTNVNASNSDYPGDSATDYAFGALEFWGNGTVSNCNFSNNYAWCSAAIAVGASTDMAISNCNFINNTGFGNGGGAIRIKTGVSAVKLTDCLFINNTGLSDGGALYLDCQLVNVTKSVFISNDAACGGAIYCSDSAEVCISSSNFTNNTAVNGSAVYLFNNAISSIDSCSFFNNSASGYGGAIYCSGKFLKVTNSDFTYDKATTGGGMYLDVGAYVYKCQFTEETSFEDGGGIYLYKKYEGQIPAGVELGVFSTNFTACHAGRDGGAGYVYSNYGVVKDSILRDCTAEGTGGAGYIWGDYGQLIQSQLINNFAKENGGALYWAGNNGTITYTSYEENRALKNGGGVYWEGDNGQIFRCNFTTNIAVNPDHAITLGNGGAVYIRGTNVAISYSRFMHGSSTHGSAIYVNGSQANITHSNFAELGATQSVNLTSDDKGGAIYVAGDDTLISYGYFTRTNSGFGGAIYVAGERTEISHATFMYNRAKSGGAIYVDGDDTNITSSTFNYLYATSEGGGIYLGGENTHITSSEFGYMNATRGGAIFIKGDGSEIESDFHHCFANFNGELEVAGGAIYVSGNNNEIRNSSFNITNAIGGVGGAIFAGGVNTTIRGIRTNTTVSIEISSPRFKIGGSGGSIYVEGDNAKILESEFRLYSATVSGGCLFVEGHGLNITNCSFQSGTSDMGGAIYIYGDNTFLTDSDFRFGQANMGGAVYIEGANTHVIHNDFKNLGATRHTINESGLDESTMGGAIYIEGSGTLILNNSFYETNSGKGGAIYVAGDNTEIFHDTFQRHNSTLGGAIYIEGDYTNITHSTFEELGASNMGGSIYVGGVGTHITASNFTHSSALRGGSIFIIGNQTVIEANFIQSFARFGPTLAVGGAVYMNGTDNEIRNSNFTQIRSIGGVGGAIFVGGLNNRIINVRTDMTAAISAGGFRADGGAIFVAGNNATITLSDLTHFSAADNGGAVYVEGDNTNISFSEFKYGNSTHGGAIYIEGSNTNVVYSNFSSIGAVGPENLNITTLGGAIHVAGDDTVISHANLTKTNAGFGGAIYVEGNRTEISHSSFLRHNSINGGAIYVTGADTHIDNSSFMMLNISGDGGSIYVGGVGTRVTSSVFSLTNATRGGAIFINGSESVIESTFDKCFANSHGGNPSAGGAIYVAGANNEIRKSNFTITMAFNGNGGAIYAGGENTTVTNIRSSIARAVRMGPGNVGSGGAIYIEGEGAKITDSVFEKYTATDNGGAMFIEGGNANITTSSFSYGEANMGGAIYISGNDTFVDGVNVTRNTAAVDGGEFYINGNGAVILNTNMSYALAAKKGGAIFISGSDNTIAKSYLSYSNSSEGYGGGIYIKGANNNITESLFEFCSATKGGAIYISGNDTYVAYSNFTKVGVSPVSGIVNHTDGGAIFIEGDNAVVDYGKFYMSSADHGGFIYVAGNDSKIMHSDFSDSLADDAGGAIYVSGHNALIDYGTFTRIDSVEGGAIYVSGSQTTISNSNFTLVLADKAGGAIYIEGPDASIAGSSFNQTMVQTGDGGAIYIEGNNANVSGSDFVYVIANNGGVIYIAGNGAVIEHSEFAYSHALVYGGSIYVAGNATLIDDSTFERHNATCGGTIYISGNDASIRNSGFFRSLSLNDNGGAIYINGTNANVFNSVFDQTLSNMSDGGAIYIAGSHANVSTCSFNESIAIKASGGVIYISGNDALVEYSNFSYSHAIIDGGSIYVAGNNAVIDHSSFRAHNATRGGTIYVRGENVNITNSNFTLSLSQNGNGGAIYIEGNSVDISNSVFERTSANDGAGGVIYIAGDYAEISDSSFKYAFADKNGGVIYIAGQNNLITKSTFEYNNATTGYGGSIYISGGFNNITHSTFGQCSSTRGGAIYINGTNTTVAYSNFTRNGIHPSWGVVNDANGGTIYVGGNYALVSHDNFNLSMANEGGFIFIGGNYAQIEYSNFTQSTAYKGGGAIDIHGHNVVITESSFRMHNATVKGGTINVDGNNVNITNSHFALSSVNGTKTTGGAIYVGGNNVDIVGCTFNRTQAVNGTGGAIHVKGENATIARSNFTFSNATENSGGAIYINGKNTNITGSFFAMCAARYGGSIYVDGDDAIIEKSNFTSNKAESNNNSIDTKGGTIFITGQRAHVDGCEFLKSEARYGGTVYIQGGNSNISFSKFNTTHAFRDGGAVYVAGNNATIYSSEFRGGNAISGGAVYLSGRNKQEANASSTGTPDINQTALHTYVFNSTFSGNTAQDGGAIYNNGGTAVIAYSNFTSNIASKSGAHGGAIYWRGGSVNDVIIGCYFIGNRVPQMNSLGGAIFCDNGDGVTYGAVIKDSVFENNYAGKHGGAIDWYHADHGLIEDCLFKDNNAHSDGGALYAGDDTSDGKNLTVRRCNFTNNNAVVRGGAISLQFEGSHVVDCLFISNSASEGGSIYSRNPKAHDCEYVNCKIINSTTHDPDRASGKGAAVFISTSRISFIECEFINCTTYQGMDGGAIYLEVGADNARIEGCNFTNCTTVLASGKGDGGAIYINATIDNKGVHAVKNVIIRDSRFTNVSAINGGAIFMMASGATISNSIFENCLATSDGGAIYVKAKDKSVTVNNIISNSTFRYNSADRGGAFFLNAYDTRISNSSIYGNLAENGAGIYLSGAQGNVIADTNITGNNATRGSGLYVENSTYALKNVKLLDNQAHATAFINKTITMDDTGKYCLVAVFTGEDNLLNGIWHDEGANANFTNVKYWNADGVAVANSVPELSVAEAGINVTVTKTLTRAADTLKTDENGTIRYYFDAAGANEVRFTLTHNDDTYYTGLSETTSTLATVITIEAADIDFGENATVKVTLKDIDGNNLTANVTVTINNTLIFTVEVINGTGLKGNISGLTPGIYNATAKFESNLSYFGSENSTLFRVRGPVNVIIIKSANPDNVSVGDKVNFTIEITNSGQSTAHNVTVTDILPLGLIYLQSGGNVTDQGNRTVVNGREVVTWNIGNLSSNATVRLWVVVGTTINGTFTNAAVANSTEDGLKTSNDVNVTVNPAVNLTIIKKADLSNVSVGDLVNFTITVVNNGPSNATDVKITDDLIREFGFVDAGGNYTRTNQKVIWTIDKLANGTNATVWVQVKVLIDGNFTNVATVNSNENRTNVTSNDTNVTVNPVVNLTIIKKADLSNVSVGDLVNFTITVINHGPSNATMVKITDELVKEFGFVDAGGNYTRTGQKVVWTIDKLTNGTNASVWVQVRVLIAGNLTNVASVNCSDNTSDVTSGDTNITVNPVVNLTIIKKADLTNVSVGELVNFTITVINNGPSNATMVKITDNLVKEFEIVDVGGNYTRTGQNIVWTIDKLENGTNTSVWVQVKVLIDGNFTNVASVNCSENKTDVTSNDTNVTVNPVVNLTIIKKADLTNVSVGDLVNFTITVINNGPSNATMVKITDDLIRQFSFVNATGNYTRTGQKLVWTIDKLANGTNTSVWVQVKVLIDGNFTNVAAVNCNENKTDITSNDTNVTVNPVVNLTVIKKADLSNVSVGDLVNFTIVVTNNGPSNATMVKITDELVKEFGFVNTTGNYTRTGQKVVWTIDKMANGTSATVWVQVRVMTNGTFTNVATVNCSENKTNVTSNDTNVTVAPKANLTIIKYLDGDVNRNISVGELIKFIITVKNNGPSNATNVLITDVLNAAFRFNSTNSTYTRDAQKIIWNITRLNVNETYRIELIVETVMNGFYTNVAIVNATESENKTSNETEVKVLPAVKLVIIKASNLTGNAKVGELVNFTIAVINNGPSVANNITVFDELDSAFEFKSSNGTYDSNTRKVIWKVDKLSKGANVTLWVQVRLLTNGTFTNVAFANCSENTTNVSSNKLNVTVDPVVVLAIEKSADRTNASVGDLINFTITVTNSGPSNATNVKITDDLVKAFGFVNASGNYTRTGQNVVWTIDKIANGTNVSVWIQVKLLANGTFTNVAVVNCTQNDANVTSNDTNVTVNPSVNLTVIKKADLSNVSVGDLVNFTITVVNNGPSNATDVKVIDELIREFEIVDVYGNPLRVGTQKLVWTIDKIANGTNATVWVQVRVLTNGTFTNVATVNCSENRTNITSNDTNVTVDPKVNLTIIKYLDGDVNRNISVGELIKFIIVVKNNGLSNATNVLITDVLNDAFKFNSTNSTYTRDAQKVIWNISRLNVNETYRIELVVETVMNGFYTNVAIVNSTESENKTSNVTEVRVLPAVKLTIIKTSDLIGNAKVGDLVNFTITVINNGPSVAHNVTVSDELNSAFEFRIASENYTLNNQKVFWKLDNISKGANVTVWVQVRLLSNGTFANVAMANCSENRTNASSNELNVTVEPVVNLTIIKKVDLANVSVGGLVNFTITVANNGPSNATMVKVTDELIREFGFVDAGGNYTRTGQKVVWTIDKIVNGANATVWVQVKVLIDGNFTNVATVNCNENKTNVTSNDTNVTVNPVVNLTIIKKADLANVSVGDLVNFTITVINNGPSNATMVKITDELIKEFGFVDAGGNYTRVTDKKVVWTIDRLANGTNTTVWVQVRVLIDGNYTNVAAVNCNENMTNVTSNDTNVTVDPVVNLTVIKKADLANVSVGDLVNFTITVINNGPSNATMVKLTDELIKEFGFVNATGNYTRSGQKLVWTIDKLANGTNASVWVQVKVLIDGNYTNVASVNCNENKTDLTSNDTNVTVNPVVNLTIIKKVDLTNVSVGDLVNFTITVINNGPSNATMVKVTDELIKEFSFVNATGNYTRTGQNVVWTIDKLANGTNTSVWVQVKVLIDGNYTNVATVNCNENETNITSNDTNVTVDPVVNLTIIKKADLSNVSVGDLVNFTITVINNGPSNATRVKVTDELVKEFGFVNATGNYTRTGQKVVWTIDKLANGTNTTVWVQVRVLIDGNYTNVATVNCNENKTNITSNDTNVTVNPVVNLTIIKKADLSNVSVGDLVNFTITVINNGPSNATMVKITDELVKEFGFVNATGNYTRTGQKVVWTIDKLANGTNTSVWVQVKVLIDGNFTNIATVNCNENDTNVTSNDTNVTVNPVVNLTIIKKADLSNVSVGDLVNFTITVINNGPSNATMVKVTDELIKEFGFVNATGNYTRTGPKVVWTIDNLSNGTNTSVWVQIRVLIDGNFTNVATVNCNENETNVTSDDTNVTVNPVVNLTVIKKADLSNVSVGDLVNFTITVINNGPSNATMVKVTDELIKEFGFVNATGNYTRTGQKLVWTIDKLANGTNVSVWVQVKVLIDGNFTNVATVSCNENKTNITSNDTNVTVNPVVNLTIIKKADLSNVSVGNLVNFTITVINNGPSNATMVKVTDELIKEFGFVNATGNYTRTGQKVVWTIDKLANGTNTSVWVQVRVLIDGNYTNVATVNCAENETNVTSNDTNVTVNPVVNLTIIKKADLSNVSVGDLVNFTITVINNGPSNATMVNITDDLINEFGFVDAGGNYTKVTAHKVVWTIDKLANGTNVTVWVQVRVLIDGNYTNVATVNCAENETNVTSNDANVTVNPVVNLTIIKKADLTNVSVGDLVNFTITVINNGPSNATMVKVTDELIREFGFVNAGGNYTRTDQKLVWTIGKLANGTNTSVWVQVKVLIDGNFTNVATVNCNENKTNITSNDTNITVNPVVNLTIIKKADLTNLSVGDLVNFTITVINNGPSDATMVEITDELIKEFGFVNAGGNYTKTGQKVVWTIDKLANGTNTSVWVQVKVLIDGNFTNVATVNCNENKTNITSNDTNVTVNPVVNLTIIKKADLTNVSVGGLVNFTITVINNGPSNATMVEITDELIKEFKFVNASGNYSRNGQTIVWTVDKLENGTNTSVWVQVKVLIDGNFTNVATVNCSENKTNITSDDTNVTVSPVVNLTIIKKADLSNVSVGDLVNFTITVTNNGPSNATMVKVTDELIKEFGFVNAGGNYTRTGQKLVWTIDKLANGANVTVWVQVKVLIDGNFTNVATVNCAENETNLTSNDTNVTVNPVVNLTIIKKADLSIVGVGDMVNFTITVINNGPSNATMVEITDELIREFGFVNAGGNYTRTGQKVVWTIDKLANATNTTVWVQVKVLIDGNFTNVATVNCNENKTNITSDDTNVTVNPVVNLTIIKKADLSIVGVGDLVNFTIIVTNNGLSNATMVEITDELIREFEFVNAGGNYTRTGQNVVWTVDKLENGTSATVWIQVKVLSEGNFTNVATVSCSENTTNITSDDANVTASPVVDLTINKTVSKTRVTIGDSVVYTITVRNIGTNNATGVEITEDLKGRVEITDIDASKGKYDRSTSKWTIDKLDAGESATLTLTVKVLKSEVVKNFVSVKANEKDINSSNNNYTCDDVTVGKLNTPIDLKTVDIVYGEDETITVTLPQKATGVLDITVGDITYSDLPITGGVVVLEVSNLDGGLYDVNVNYGGDGNYKGNSTKGTFKVSPRVPVINIEVVDIFCGEIEVLNVTIDASGTVNVTIGNKTVTISLDHGVVTSDLLSAGSFTPYDGFATWNIKDLKVGTYGAVAVYGGNENYASVNTSAVFNVKPLPSNVEVSVDDIYVGEDAIIKVLVGPANATGKVTVKVDGKTYVREVKNGAAEIKVSGLKSGVKNVDVTYSGDDTYLPSENSTTFEVKKVKPPIDVDSHDIKVGDDEKIRVTLPGDATGTVTITVDGKKYTAPVKNGVAEFNVPGLKAGKYDVDAVYSGDDKYLPSEGSDTFRVSKANPHIDVDAPDITVGDDGVITVELPEDATGTVTIEIDGKKYTAPVKNGKAVFRIPGLKVGKHDIEVSYSGDDKYLPATAEGDIDVHPAGGSKHHEPIGLEKHATGNPIMILLVVLLSLCGVAIRKLKK